VILAAGEGRRMRSVLPKVLHCVAGRSLVEHVVESAAHLAPERIVVVVGHGREQVTAHIAEISPWVTTVVQEEQRGTGHAVRVTLDAIGAIDGGPIVVLTGDTPLLTGFTLETLLAHHSTTGAAATVLTAVLDDPTGYGRIVRSADGQVSQIVEHRDADEEVLSINEINSGMYAFDAAQEMRK
jgi:bifunctional UDP-N-acetylglucosamine pyrophosphorylase/glucosamine-1-phosphate N-acetyltransferase